MVTPTHNPCTVHLCNEVAFLLLPSPPCSRLERQPRNRLPRLLSSFNPSLHLRFLWKASMTPNCWVLKFHRQLPTLGAHTGLSVVNHSSLPSVSSRCQGPEPGDSAPQTAFQWSWFHRALCTIAVPEEQRRDAHAGSTVE